MASALCSIVAAAALSDVAHGQSASATAASPSSNAPNRDYDYQAVCVFAELVEGYVLPALDDRFFRSNARLKQLPSVPSSVGVERRYEYRGDGFVSTTRGYGSKARFEFARIEASRIPRGLRSKDSLTRQIFSPISQWWMRRQARSAALTSEMRKRREPASRPPLPDLFWGFEGSGCGGRI